MRECDEGAHRATVNGCRCRCCEDVFMSVRRVKDEGKELSGDLFTR